jgi:FG-GAP-like repeat
MLNKERSLPATLLLLTCCLIQPTKIIAIGFTSPEIYASGSNPAGIATRDFNKDGKLDVCVANSGSLNISIFLGRGDGTFLTAVKYQVPQAPQSIAVSDFNHDGNLDVVVANAGSISVLLDPLSPIISTVVGRFTLWRDSTTRPSSSARRRQMRTRASLWHTFI